MTNEPSDNPTDVLEEQAFYELMQAYRHAPITDPAGTVAAFEAVKVFVRAAYAAGAESVAVPRELIAGMAAQLREARLGHDWLTVSNVEQAMYDAATARQDQSGESSGKADTTDCSPGEPGVTFGSPDPTPAPDDLVRRLRDPNERNDWMLREQAAARIEADAKRIAELESQRDVAENGYHHAIRTAKWQASTNAELNEAAARLAEATRVIAELVACKDLREMLSLDYKPEYRAQHLVELAELEAEYQKRKPIAWKAARAFLEGTK